jgi:hypothetical protein
MVQFCRVMKETLMHRMLLYCGLQSHQLELLLLGYIEGALTVREGELVLSCGQQEPHEGPLQGLWEDAGLSAIMGIRM